MKHLGSALRGGTLTARSVRSALWTLTSYGGAQAIRLASNLILTRILFPEAFGLMALVSMVTVGLMMFSDVGVGPNIQRSERGDDPDYLDTAWSLQAIRGFVLFGATVLLAGPMAVFFEEPDLARFLPVAGIGLVVAGFLPTRIETAKRHLQFGRLTVLELASQAIGLGIMVIVALVTRSVAALVLGSIITNLALVVLASVYLPGHRNRFRIERTAMQEQVGFGKWVFLSTAFAFLSLQGDKAILGKLLSLEALGIYNIGFFLASFPMMLGQSVAANVLIPLYRSCPPAKSAENRRKLRKMRFLLSGAVFALLGVMAFLGPWLVGVLYDDRYIQAGGMLVIVASGLLAQGLGLSYDRAALAAGDSLGVFAYNAIRSTVQLSLLYFGLVYFGLVGGLASTGIAYLVVHPVLIHVANRNNAWDALHDAVFLPIGLAIAAGAVSCHMDTIMQLSDLFGG